MNATYLIFLGLYLTSLMIRSGYELLKKSGQANPKNKKLFAFVFMTMCLMWTSWFVICPLDPIHLSLPRVVRWIGLGALLAGCGLALGALIRLKGLENIDHLITTGLFARLRHPMYTGFILWILGWAIYHQAVVSLMAGLAGIGSILYWRRLEEEALETRYRKDFLIYRRQTWF